MPKDHENVIPTLLFLCFTTIDQPQKTTKTPLNMLHSAEEYTIQISTIDESTGSRHISDPNQQLQLIKLCASDPSLSSQNGAKSFDATLKSVIKGGLGKNHHGIEKLFAKA